jgi:NAD(P)-dependent dehydrogenase (short-subunit alcohol dehydrogenase family)
MDRDLVVVVGVGDMGLAIARRVGAGRRLMIGDADAQRLAEAASTLRDEGHEVIEHGVDVSDRRSVANFADLAERSGRVAYVVHTAGLSPVQASTEAILRVDLLGPALILEAFGQIVPPGGAGVVIASMAAYMTPQLERDQESALASTPAAELLGLSFLEPERVRDPGQAYSLAKRANQLRVQAAAVEWGRRHARVKSISPGVISTSMGRQELGGEHGEEMRMMVDMSPSGRLGTADDIAAAASFLLSNEASFVTGADLLVDGGAVAAVRSLIVGQVAAGERS